MAQAKNREAAHKRMAQPKNRETTRKRMAQPKNREANRKRMSENRTNREVKNREANRKRLLLHLQRSHKQQADVEKATGSIPLDAEVDSKSIGA